MSRPTESQDQEIRTGTEALKDIAEDVEVEREQSSGKSSLPSDEAEEAVGPPAEDPEGEGVIPQDPDEVRVYPPARPLM